MWCQISQVCQLYSVNVYLIKKIYQLYGQSDGKACLSPTEGEMHHSSLGKGTPAAGESQVDNRQHCIIRAVA